MKIIENEVSKELRDEHDNFQNYLSFLKEEWQHLGNDNLVLNLLNVAVDPEEILQLLKFSEEHKERNKSFVVVITEVDIDEVPEVLSVVPTLMEAEDLIQMEEIERDLGF